MKPKNTNRTVHSVLLLAAFSLEEKALFKAIERAKKGKINGLTDLGIKVFNMGAGRKRSLYSLKKYLDRNHPDFVLLTGIAGGVFPDLKAGDIVFPREVCLVEESGKISDSLSLSSKSNGDFMNILRSKYKVYDVPKLATVDRLFHKQDKVKLNNIDNSIALVDMESYGVVDLLRARKIPFLLFRVVSDPLNSKFPDDSFFRSLAELRGLKKWKLIFQRPLMCLRFLGMLPALNKGLKILSKAVYIFISNAWRLTAE